MKKFVNLLKHILKVLDDKNLAKQLINQKRRNQVLANDLRGSYSYMHKQLKEKDKIINDLKVQLKYLKGSDK